MSHGGFAILLALGLALSACAAPGGSGPVSASAMATYAASASPTAAASPSPPTVAASASAPGFVFTTLFVTVTDSRNGRVSAVANPGASCSGVARFPDNVTVRQLALQVAPASGMLVWSYQPAPPAGSPGVHRIECLLGQERTAAEARFAAE